MKVPFRVYLSLGLLLLLSSCSAFSDRLSLFEAAMRHSRGDDQGAISLYLRVASHSSLKGYADYGLGTVYLSLGETESALSRFKAVFESAPARELGYRAHYNAGLAHWARASFQDAASEFRSALELDPGRTDAKRNLELAQRELSRRQSSASAMAPVALKGTSTANKSLFDFIREKEGDRWKSREWQVPSQGSLDY